MTAGLVAAEEHGAQGLQELVTHAGGQVAAAPPTGSDTHQCLVLGSDLDLKKERAWAAKRLPKGTNVHSRSMLVDAILRQTLDHRQGVLFTV